MRNMKALILNNKVVDIQETEFEVHNSMTWVECDNTVKQGFNYDGTTFINNENQEELSEIQNAINKKASGKQKLKDLGLTEDEVKALIGA